MKKEEDFRTPTMLPEEAKLTYAFQIGGVFNENEIDTAIQILFKAVLDVNPFIKVEIVKVIHEEDQPEITN